MGRLSDTAQLRDEMVVRHLAARNIRDPRVLAAFRRVERHRFVPGDLVDRAYEDRALPIGSGQTISQPYIVALMTQCLDLRGGERVLEIGHGFGLPDRDPGRTRGRGLHGRAHRVALRAGTGRAKRNGLRKYSRLRRRRLAGPGRARTLRPYHRNGRRAVPARTAAGATRRGRCNGRAHRLAHGAGVAGRPQNPRGASPPATACRVVFVPLIGEHAYDGITYAALRRGA